MTETESQIKMKQETHEEQEVTGRQERNDVESRGEQSNKDERETKDHQEELKEGLRRSEEERKQSVKKEKVQEARKHQNIRKVKKHVKKQNDDHMEVDDAAHSQYAAITQQHETMKWTKEQQMLSEQKETQEYLREHDEDQMEVKEHSGLQFPPSTEEPKEQPVLVKETKPFNLISHLNSDQEPWREKELLVEKRQSNLDRKKSDTEKKRSEKNRSGVNKIYSMFKAPKKTQKHWREKLLTERREKNQRKNQSETRMEREKDETEVKIRKSKNQHHKEEKTQERREEEPESEKHGEGNQRDRMGMTERKTEEQRDQEESRNSSVSSKVTVNTDLKTQEKQPEEKSEQSREEIREQSETQRRAQSEGGGQRELVEINEGVTSDGTNRKEREKLQLRHEGALQAEQQENVNQKEEPEEPVSVTERGVDCLEEPQKDELMDETADVDQHNIQSRKHTQELKLHEVCNLPAKKQKIQEEGRRRKHQNVRKVKKFVKKQNDDHMEVDDAAHSQYAAITQQHETMKWTKEQQMLSEQKETQEYLREHDEDLMEVK